MSSNEIWINAGPLDGAYVVRRQGADDDVAFIPTDTVGNVGANDRAERIARLPAIERCVLAGDIEAARRAMSHGNAA